MKKLLSYFGCILSKKFFLKKLKSQNNNKEGDFLNLCTPKLRNKTFFEIGFGSYEFNCSNLIKKNYQGYLVDGNKINCLRMSILNKVHKLNLTISNTFVSKKNIHKIVPNDLGGIFSIDIDGNDYWILKEVLGFNNNLEIIIVEYNASFKKRCVSIPYQENFKRHRAHKSGWYHGASLNAFIKLLSRHNYYLIQTVGGVNAIFVNKKIFENLSFKQLTFENAYEEGKLRNKWSNTNASYQYEMIKHLPLLEV